VIVMSSAPVAAIGPIRQIATEPDRYRPYRISQAIKAGGFVLAPARS
jgi:hypothetical protein